MSFIFAGKSYIGLFASNIYIFIDMYWSNTLSGINIIMTIVSSDITSELCVGNIVLYLLYLSTHHI